VAARASLETEAAVGTVDVVGVHELGEASVEVALVDDDHVVQTLDPD
jgi:hypothetical protein